MTKSKTFTSNHDVPITIAVPGHSVVSLEPGESVETSDAAVIAALEGNPDVDAGKKKKS